MFEKLGKFFKLAGMFMLCFLCGIGLFIAFKLLPAIAIIFSLLLLGCGLVYWAYRLVKALCNLLVRLLKWLCNLTGMIFV